jgi:two-component system cell cycle response regulator
MSVPPPGSDDGSEKTTVLSGDQATLKKELEKAKDQPACLIMVRGTPQGQRFFLTQDGMVIGRDPSADISIADQGISRKHAKLSKDGGGKVVIEDMGSSNGTFINDKKIEANKPIALAKEDMVRVGSSILKFLPAGELETLMIGNLSSAAHTDALTKIFNKGYLLEALEVEFKRARALHTELCLLYFDLDFFKKVNDGYGHDAGDFVLKEFTALIRTSHLRPKDIFARFGGEEFVVLLGNTSLKDATNLAERIRAAVESHAFIYEGKKLPVTTSMGVAEMRADTENGQALMKTADKALYQAKQTGRNKVVVAT